MGRVNQKRVFLPGRQVVAINVTLRAIVSVVDPEHPITENRRITFPNSRRTDRSSGMRGSTDPDGAVVYVCGVGGGRSDGVISGSEESLLYRPILTSGCSASRLLASRMPLKIIKPASSARDVNSS